MAMEIVLEDQSGAVIDQVLDPHGDLGPIWPFDDTAFPLLHCLDPYGDTVFNGRQMVQVLRELELMIGRAGRDRQRILIGRVKVLAQRCRDSPRRYLRFAGD